MATRRCSGCAINFPTTLIGGCPYCEGELNYFSDDEAHEDWQERVALLNWRAKEANGTPEVGVTFVEKFALRLDSLIGVDDFFTDLGDRPAPVGFEVDDDA